jgi:hypothetical protein
MESTVLCREIDSCRICGGGRFDEVFNLGEHALSGRFPAEGEPDAPRAPLCVVRCTDCGLIQLKHNFERDALYRHDYGYRSGINESMRRHLAGLARAIERAVPLQPGDAVLDIGSNDGTLLRSYAVPNGVMRVGMDPTVAQFPDAYGDDLIGVPDYFNAESFARAADGRKAKVVTSIAMFYDLPDPNGFVAAVARSLAPEGIWVLEQAYLPSMLTLNAFDAICHEHLEYYALAQIETVLGRYGLRVFDVALNDVNGGSIRVHACHQAAPFTETPAVAAMRADEDTFGLATAAPYEAFWQRVAGIRARLVDFLESETAQGRIVFGYGASTKGNTTLQFCGITRRLIPAVAERNPAKWGRRLPATGIPIISEEEARRRQPDYFLAFPWHFRDSFLAREKAFLAGGGRFIFPMPEFDVV